jgi:hypothetical protein
VKTKVHTARSPTASHCLEERDKLFLEVHVQNQTNFGLWFESFEFQPEPEFVATDASAEAERASPIPITPEMRHATSILQPKDIRQMVYILTPAQVTLFPKKYNPGFVPLGKLDISWRSEMGESGRLLTSVSRYGFC